MTSALGTFGRPRPHLLCPQGTEPDRRAEAIGRKCREAIDKELHITWQIFWYEKGFQAVFKSARMTVYQRELYDYAECVNLCVLLRARLPELEKVMNVVISDVLTPHGSSADGSLTCERIVAGWDNVSHSIAGLSRRCFEPQSACNERARHPTA
jgi:hypothetical protein